MVEREEREEMKDPGRDLPLVEETDIVCIQEPVEMLVWYLGERTTEEQRNR